MDEQLENDLKQESSLFVGSENGTFNNNSDFLENTVEIWRNSNEENVQKSNLIGPENSEVPALPNSAPDKEFFDKLFDWNAIEERLKEPKMQFAKQNLKNDSQNLKANQEHCSVKLREKQFCTPKSEAERKRKSKDLLQNRRSTGFLSFEDVENVIKEIEEIGSTIQKSLASAKNDPEPDGGSTEQLENVEIIEKTSADIVNIDNSDYGSVILREKKSSPHNSAASRKRRSRNLLLNRRSTGYVSAEDVEKAKSMDQQDNDINLDLDD